MLHTLSLGKSWRFLAEKEKQIKGFNFLFFFIRMTFFCIFLIFNGYTLHHFYYISLFSIDFYKEPSEHFGFCSLNQNNINKVLKMIIYHHLFKMYYFLVLKVALILLVM